MNAERKDGFASMFEAEMKSRPGRSAQKAKALSLGESVRGEVVQVGRDSVFVEVLDRATLGKRPQAAINVQDLRDPSGELKVKPGDVIEAIVVDRCLRHTCDPTPRKTVCVSCVRADDRRTQLHLRQARCVGPLAALGSVPGGRSPTWLSWARGSRAQ